MQEIFRRGRLYPWLTILAGMVGFALRCWLFSAIDASGLLPKNIACDGLCFVLLAAVIAICWLGTKQLSANGQIFARSIPAATGVALGALGFLLSAFTASGVGILRIVTPVAGILAAVALGYTAYCRYKGLRPSSLFHSGIVVYLMVRTMAHCHIWSAETQLQLYIFQLFASVFLILSAYYRAELNVTPKNIKRYAFFNQAALFCCCLCCVGQDWLFYLSCGFWMAADTYIPAAAERCQP